MFRDAPEAYFCAENKRLYLRHGPIDLFVSVESTKPEDEKKAYRLVSDRFKDILPNLCKELTLLRTPISKKRIMPEGVIAKHMCDAAFKFSGGNFLTPMIAVAGSVADHLVNLIKSSVPAKRIIVNNGGDISFHLCRGESINIGICNNVAETEISATAKLSANDGLGGVATSGWKGRSYSMGIADAVTVIAKSAADADAAATLIANAIDLPGSNKVERVPANMLNPDSDLGDRLVTTNVASLSDIEINFALNRGQDLALNMLDDGLIHSAYLFVQGKHLVIQDGVDYKTYCCVKPAVQMQSNPTGIIHA